MRKPGWPEILVAKISEWKTIPFEWGTTDCAMFVVDVVNAMTDRQIVNRALGAYGSERGALRSIAALGGNLSDLVTLRFGAPIAPGFAQRGDVLLREGNLGICVGVNGAFRTPDGVVDFPTLDCECAWRVE